MEKPVIRLNHPLTSAKNVLCLNSAFFSKPSRCCPALHIYSTDIANVSVCLSESDTHLEESSVLMSIFNTAKHLQWQQKHETLPPFSSDAIA